MKEQQELNDGVVRNKIDLSDLKKFALERLPANCPLREVLLAEGDEVEISTFLARLPVYLRLSSIKRS
jgi:hypothetical protein